MVIAGTSSGAYLPFPFPFPSQPHRLTQRTHPGPLKLVLGPSVVGTLGNGTKGRPGPKAAFSGGMWTLIKGAFGGPRGRGKGRRPVVG